MSKAVAHISQFFEDVSPKHRQIIHGVAVAIDPCPHRIYRTFIQSNEEALLADWTAVGHDMMAAIAKAQNGQKRSSG